MIYEDLHRIEAETAFVFQRKGDRNGEETRGEELGEK